VTSRTVAVAAVGGAALIAGAVILVGLADDEERPPIVVKHGSIVMEVADLAGKPRRPWAKDLIGRQWKPKQPKGKDVVTFDVVVTGADGTCNPMSGDEITVDYVETAGQTRTFRFYRQRFAGFGKHEPKVDSPVDLTVDNSTVPRLMYSADGKIRKVTVGGQSCNFPDSTSDRSITLTPK
jgi:hypothetical protein